VDVLAHPGPGDQLEPLTPLRLLTGWTFEPVPLLAVAVVAAAYLAGVVRLRRRGDAWPLARTVSFVGLGLGCVAIATCSALGAYDTALLSIHMVQHMVLSMVVPIFLALGAPVTLALRTLPDRPRSWLLGVLHSRAAKVLAFPPLALALFIASPWALYFSGWYEATLRSAVLHDLLHLHFVAVGALFFWPLLGRDPVPGRLSHPLRLILIFLTLPFHAFLGVTMMSMNTLIARDWYRSLDLGWAAPPAADQYLAGSLLWATGDLVGLLFFGVLFVQWVRDSHREAVREDRRLDRLEAIGAGKDPAR
jgi:putative copper resistance protein D